MNAGYGYVKVMSSHSDFMNGLVFISDVICSSEKQRYSYEIGTHPYRYSK